MSYQYVRIAIILLITVQPGFANEKSYPPFSSNNQSFAEQYDVLADLLSKVKDRESALNYKDQIQEQLALLSITQSSGEMAFKAMSKDEQILFVKRFQKNRYHCGEVTQVMQERRRILLNPELSSLLGDLLREIP